RGDLQPGRLVAFAAHELFAGQLAAGNRVETDDADRNFTVGNALDLERVHTAERRDLLEGERRVFDQPDRRCLGHERERHTSSKRTPFLAVHEESLETDENFGIPTFI